MNLVIWLLVLYNFSTTCFVDQVALGSLALAAFMHYEATTGGGVLGKGVLIGFLTCAAAVASLARLWALAVTMKATMPLTMVFPLVGTYLYDSAFSCFTLSFSFNWTVRWTPFHLQKLVGFVSS